MGYNNMFVGLFAEHLVYSWQPIVVVENEVIPGPFDTRECAVIAFAKGGSYGADVGTSRGWKQVILRGNHAHLAASASRRQAGVGDTVASTIPVESWRL
ncbi:MAG TPA: hypothetical protein VEL06_15295 [Haliangiales bacterium]|nr:hypothetical protein [Haliangiales bacterium]